VASDGSAAADWIGVTVPGVALEGGVGCGSDEVAGDDEPPVAPHAVRVAKRRAHASGRIAATSGKVPETARTLETVPPATALTARHTSRHLAKELSAWVWYGIGIPSIAGFRLDQPYASLQG
jgi:hypothetical protein